MNSSQICKNDSSKFAHYSGRAGLLPFEMLRKHRNLTWLPVSLPLITIVCQVLIKPHHLLKYIVCQPD